MTTAVENGNNVSLDELYRVMRVESEEALLSAKHGLSDADFRSRVRVPSCFPEEETRAEKRRDAAGRPRRRWV